MCGRYLEHEYILCIVQTENLRITFGEAYVCSPLAFSIWSLMYTTNVVAPVISLIFYGPLNRFVNNIYTKKRTYLKCSLRGTSIDTKYREGCCQMN